MKTVEYLDACRAKLGLTSDYQLGQRLGLTRQAISKYRCEGVTFNTATAKKVAEILGVHPLRVRADAELERAKTPEDRALWRELAGKIGAVLVFAGAGGLLSIAGGNYAHAAAAGGFDNNFLAPAVSARPRSGLTTHCRRILARALAWLRGWL